MQLPVRVTPTASAANVPPKVFGGVLVLAMSVFSTVMGTEAGGLAALAASVTVRIRDIVVSGPTSPISGGVHMVLAAAGLVKLP